MSGTARERPPGAAHAAATGHAPASGPVPGPHRVTTGSEGLGAGWVSIPAEGGTLRAYRAAPLHRPTAPVVLVVSEIFGVHEYIADVVRRFAHEGFFTVAPDLLARQGDPNAFDDIPTLMAQLIARVPDEQVMGDLDAALAWAAREGADASRLGVTGFCWGGRMTWLYAAHQPALRAGVAWYGRLKGNPTPLQPSHPLEIAGALKAPVLGLYGGQDSGIPLDTVDKMNAALADGGPASRASRIEVYPDAPHGFHADYRASFHPEAAADAWNRCLRWFRDHGVA